MEEIKNKTMSNMPSTLPTIRQEKECRIPRSRKSCHFGFLGHSPDNQIISGCTHQRLSHDTPKGVCPDEAVPADSGQDGKPVVIDILKSSLFIGTDPQSDV